MLSALPCLGSAQTTGPQPGGQGGVGGTRGDITYRIDLTDRQGHQIGIVVGLRGFEEDQLVLELPAWVPRHAVNEMGRHVSDLVAEGPDQLPLAVERTGLHRWTVESGGLEEVTVRYRVYANTPSPWAARLDPAHAYLNPAAVLLYLRGAEAVPITLQFEVPAAWKVATVLEPTFDPTMFRAADYREIVQTPVMASRFQERFAAIGGMNVSFFFTSVPPGLDLDVFLANLQALIARAESLFGVLPATDYVFLFHFPNLPVREAMGTPGASVVHWGLQALDGDTSALLRLSLRALLESWLGGVIRPAALVGAPLNEPFVTDSLWFLDGVAEYMAEVLMVRAGLRPRVALLDRLGAEITRLQNTPAREFRSVADASNEVWFEDEDWYRSPARNLDHRNKGFLLALLLDLEMRASTGNTQSLDDLVSFLSAYYSRSTAGFGGSRDLLRTAGALSRTDLTPFLVNYVLGTDELPYDRLFAAAGWTLRRVAEEVATLGFETDAEGPGALRVTVVEERSPASQAGLRSGDRIVSVNGSFVVGRLPDLVAASRPGDILTLRVQRGVREMEISFPLGQGNRQAYVVEPLAEPTESQRAVLAALLGEPG